MSAALYYDRIIIRGDMLFHGALWQSAQVNLSKLVSAERYANDRNTTLALTDSEGNTVHISIYNYLNQINTLADLLDPYIFLNTVDKNFMSLNFMRTVNLADAPVTWRMLLKGILTVLLALTALFMLVTAFVLLYAHLTNH